MSRILSSPRRITRISALLGLALVAMLAVGCNSASKNDPITSASLRSNPTPELASLSRTWEQDRNERARIMDHNKRAIWNDLEKVLLLDRTSSLTGPYWLP